VGYDPQNVSQAESSGGTSESTAEQQSGAATQPGFLSGFPTADTAPNCPACGWGFLYPIAKTESGTLLHCFHCLRSLSVPDEGEVGAPAVQGAESPTAAQPTYQQLGDQLEAHPDHPVQEFHPQQGQGGK
jgi:hypothetical protein